MPNLLKLTAEEPDALLNASMYGAGAIIRVQSATSEAGAYANETTVAIVSGTRAYTAYDTDGTTTTWYRTRYENAGGTVVSEWSAAFQVGGEEPGYICSLTDVRQAAGVGTSDTSNDEHFLELMAEVTTDITGYTGRRFVRSPLAGTSTFLFDVSRDSRELAIPQGITGLTTVEVATESQPESGGTYTTVSTADWMLRPTAHERASGWPATSIVIRDNPSGSISSFHAGYNTARLTTALGWASVPPDVSGLAVRLILRRFTSDQSAATSRGGTGSDSLGRWVVTLEEKRKLDWYRVPVTR